MRPNRYLDDRLTQRELNYIIRAERLHTAFFVLLIILVAILIASLFPKRQIGDLYAIACAYTCPP